MVKKVVLTAIFIKLVIFILIVIAFNLLPFSVNTYYANFHYPFNSRITLQTAFSTWDAQHYLFLGRYGYHPGLESDRFYPLLPGLIGILTPIFGAFFSGMLFANVISIIGFVYFYLFVKELTKNEKTAYLSFLLLISFPTAFYFSLIYSEAIFLGIIMPLFYYLYKRRFLLVFVLSVLLPLLRPTGIFILFPLFVFIVYDYLKDKKFSFKPSTLLLLAPFIGFGLDLIVIYHSTGNFFTQFIGDASVVGGWSVGAIFHPNIFIQSLIPAHPAIHGFTNSIIDRLFFVLFLVLLPLVFKKTDKVLFIYTLAMGIVPVFGSFMSYTRYLLLAFPIFIAMAVFFSAKKEKYVFPYFYISLLFQALFIILHSLNYWVS